jgi:hypothetical protein
LQFGWAASSSGQFTTEIDPGGIAEAAGEGRESGAAGRPAHAPSIAASVSTPATRRAFLIVNI